jgi:hypothetical protein
VPQSFEGELEDAREKLAHYARTYTYEELSTKNYPHGLDTANLEVRVRAVVLVWVCVRASHFLRVFF